METLKNYFKLFLLNVFYYIVGEYCKRYTDTILNTNKYRSLTNTDKERILRQCDASKLMLRTLRTQLTHIKKRL